MAVNTLDDTLNTPTVNSEPLLHELQLGEQLNKCVRQSRRSDFALMLAMLCDDVREQSQFILPKSAPIDGTSTDTPTITNQVLRKYFELPDEAPLALKNIEQINQFNQAKLVADNNLITLHLTNALKPNPLSFRNDVKHIPTDVLSNTSVICQLKQKQKNPEKVINKPLNMQVESWLKNIQTSIVKSSLLNVAA